MQNRLTAPARWLPALAWMCLIFWGSSIPQGMLPESPPFLPAIAHFAEYFILAALIFRAANGGFRRGLLPTAPPVAFILTTLYAASDEVHQLFVPGRVADLMDVLLDGLGAAAAVIFLSLLLTLHRREPEPRNGRST